MLGLSLFNFGAAWRKSGQDEAFKRSKQIRKKEKEELKPDTKAVMDIAEQEASSVIKETQEQTTTQQLEESQRMSTAQMMLRYGAIGVWAVAAGLFFSSMIFNYPFSLGKNMLSLLPGIPHVATLSLQAQQRFVPSDQDVAIELFLDTNKEKSQAVRARILFDEEKVDFLKYEPSEMFGNVSFNKTGQETIDLLLEMPKEKELEFDDAKIATLYFRPIAADGVADMKLDKNESWVYAKKEEQLKNILGKTENTSIRLILPDKFLANCHQINFKPVSGSSDNWRAFVMGELLPTGQGKWTNIKNNIGLICGYDQERAYLLLLSEGFNMDNVAISNNSEETNISRIENIAAWSENGRNYLVIPVAREKIESQLLEFDFYGNNNSVHWPEKGTVQFEFK